MTDMKKGTTRRRFVKGALIGAAIAGLPSWLMTDAEAMDAGLAAGETRIPLTPSMVLNEDAIGGAAGAIVDEQNAIGDPAGGKGIAPKSPFFAGWTSWQYPVHLLIDLGAQYHVTRLFFYNATGKSDIQISTGKPFAWKPQDVTLDRWQAWQEVPVNSDTRYLRITLLHPESISEMAAYGTLLEKVSHPSAKPVRPHRPRVTMDQFIGSNGFIDDPTDQLAEAGGFVREYHSWQWDTEGKDGQIRFQPSGAAGGDLWFFDDYYRRLKAHGVTVCPCIQGNSPACFPAEKFSDKPIPAGANPEDAASYALHSAHLFQYAARYGNAGVPDSLLKLAPGQPRVSGLGLIRYLENWNEPDNTWTGRAGRFNPYELSAMCSADYDGHKGALGKGHGVKAADPGMKLVLSGLADWSRDFLGAMKLWSDVHRGGDFPVDALNVHHYSSNAEPEHPWTTGISPEADKLREKIADLVRWRDENAPGKEIWVTEFGYDTNPASPLHAPAIGSMSAEQVQAAWLLRSYFALASAGVDRAAMFMFRDTNSKGGGVFETCGLVTEKGHWQPKPSYYCVSMLKSRLHGLYYSGEAPTGRPDVLACCFADGQGKTRAYALWCPTSEDHHVAGFRFNAGAGKWSHIAFTFDSAKGAVSPLQSEQGAVRVDVGEMPSLIVMG
jgi:hypothetical protein